MRTIPTTEGTILANTALQTDRVRAVFRAKIKDNAGVYQTYQAQVVGGKIDGVKDEQVRTAEIKLLYRGATNLSPYANAAKPIDYSRDIQIECAYVQLSGGVYTPLTFVQVFDGFIQEVDISDLDVMVIKCRDNMGRLVDRFTETAATYGGGARVDTVIQTILTAWASPAVTLYVPVAPSASLTVDDYEQPEAPLSEIIRKLALRSAWDIGYIWDSGTSSYRLTLKDPARANTTSSYTFKATMFRGLSNWGVSRNNIRNKIEVPYGFEPNQGSVIVTDSTSITKNGTLYMRIGTDQGLQFNNSTQATTFANAILSDLASPFLDAQYEVPFFPWADLNDIYTFEPTNKQYDSNQVLAVVGITHEWELKEERYSTAKTTLALRGKPVGGHSFFTPIGNIPTPPAPGVVTPPTAPTGLAGNFTTKDAVISWNPVLGASEYQVVVKVASVIKRTETFAASQSPGYTYTWEKNKIDNTNPSASVTFEVKAARAVHQGGILSSAATVALTNAVPSAPSGLSLTGKVLSFSGSVTASTEGDIDYLEVQSDDGSGFASPSSFKTYSIAGFSIPVESTSGLTYVRARWVDVFGGVSAWSSTVNSGATLVGNAHIASQAVNIAQMATGIVPPQLYNSATLPTLPNAQYPQSAVLYNSHATNNGLWQTKNGTTWERLVDGVTDIQLQTVGSNQLVPGAMANLVPNAQFSTGDTTNWLALAQASNITVVPSSGGGVPINSPHPFVCKMAPTTAAQISIQTHSVNFALAGDGIPVNPGEKYFAHVDVTSGATTIDGTPVLLALFYRPGLASASATFQSRAGSAFTGAWEKLSGVVTVPAGATKMVLYMSWTPATASGELYFTNLQCWKQATTSLIEDAAITNAKILDIAAAKLTGQITSTQITDSSISTPKLAAGAVTTAKIAANAVTANEIAANTITAGQIAANAITAGKIAAGVVTATELASESIYTKHLAIGDYSNLIPNPNCTNTSPPSGTPEAAGLFNLGSGFSANGWYRRVQTASAGSIVVTESARITCAPGDKFYLEAKGFMTTVTGTANIFITWLNSAGGVISSVSSNNIASNSGASPTLLSTNATAPALAAFIRVGAQMYGQTALNEAYFSEFVLRRMTEGKVIVDGTIKASKIDVVDINAGKLYLGANSGARTELDYKGERTYDASNNLRTASGDIGGLQWGSGSLPGGTTGFYGAGSGVYLTDYPRMIAIIPIEIINQQDTWSYNPQYALMASTAYTSITDIGNVVIVKAGRRLQFSTSFQSMRLFVWDAGYKPLFYEGFTVLYAYSLDGTSWVSAPTGVLPSDVSFRYVKAIVTFYCRNNAALGAGAYLDTSFTGLVSITDSP